MKNMGFLLLVLVLSLLTIDSFSQNRARKIIQDNTPSVKNTPSCVNGGKCNPEEPSHEKSDSSQSGEGTFAALGNSFFSFNIIAEFPDMLNNLFKSTIAIEGAWVYAFEKYVFLEIGSTYQMISTSYDNLYMTGGVGWQSSQYYMPEIVLESQLIGGHTLRFGLRNNIFMPTDKMMFRLFLDLGGAYLQDDHFPETRKSWSYYLKVGMGFLL